jgi:hypothetical protein
LLSLTASAIYLLLVDLGKNVRQLNLQANSQSRSLRQFPAEHQRRLSRSAV